MAITTRGGITDFLIPSPRGVPDGYVIETLGDQYVLNSPSGAGFVTSVSNSDGTLTISPTAGAVIASLNVTHANTWTANQTISGASLGVGISSGTTATFSKSGTGYNNELLLQDNASGYNNLALQNNNIAGYSANSFRNYSGNEKMAIGYGNPSAFALFAGCSYIETSDASLGASAPPLAFVQSTTYNGELSYDFHPRLVFEANGEINFYQRDSGHFIDGGSYSILNLYKTGATLTLTNRDTGGLDNIIQGNDSAHSITLRAGTGNNNSHYSGGDTLALGGGHKFYTGGAKAGQTLKLEIANDGLWIKGPVAIGNTLTPVYTLDIETAGYQKLRLRSTDDAAYMVLGSEIASSQYWTVGAEAVGGGNSFNIGTCNSTGGSFASRLSISSAGAATISGGLTTTTGTFTSIVSSNGLTVTPGLSGGTRSYYSACSSSGSFDEMVLAAEDGSLAGLYKNGSTRSADGGAYALNLYTDTGVFNMRAGGNINLLTGAYPGTNRMAIASSTGYVGFGVSNPAVHFHLSDADVTTASSLLPSGLVFFSTAQTSNNDFYLITANSSSSNFFACTRARGTLTSPTTVSAADVLGSLIFNAYNGSSVNYLRAYIQGIAENSGGSNGALIFGVNNGEQWRINSSGQFGDVTSPLYNFHNSSTTYLAGRVRVGTDAGSISGSNFGDLQLISAQNAAACFSVTQNNVATGHFGFKATSSICYIGTDGPTLAVMSNPTNAFTGTEIARFDLTNTRFAIGGTPTSTLHSFGSFATAYIAKTANYTATISDRVIDCTSGTFTVTLPTAVGIAGREYVIKNTGTGVITVATTSSQTIDGTLTYSLSVQYQSITVVSNNANWGIV